MRKTKKRLLSSLIALLLCFAMLLGSTFAWFTDSVTSADNVIKTGNFDIEMYFADTLLPADSTEWQPAKDVPIFTYNKWEPGYTDVKYVKISNLGNLALKWKLNITPQGELTALADVIDVYYVNPVDAEVTTLNGKTSAGVLSDVIENHKTTEGVLLPVGESDPDYATGDTIIAIAFHMQEEAGNEYRDMYVDNAGFGINLLAAQFNYETDAFNNPDYDIDAEWEAPNVNFAASTAVSATNLVYGALANDLVIGGEGINATVPANVKLADGATNLALTVKAVETDANLTIGEGAAAMGLDVHIDGIAADNTVPMIVNLGPIFKPGLDKTEIKLYHTENGVPVVMTRVESVNDFARHNQFTYNAATGEVTIYVATFSVFSVVQAEVSTWNGQDVATGFEKGTGTEADPFVIKTAAQLVYFRNQVDAGVSFDDQYVKLASDIDLRNYLFDPIGFGYTYGKDSTTAFMGTFDGGNHTIYNLYQNGWDLDPDKTNYSTYTYSTAGGGLFASIENATIKNLVVSGADIKFECVDIGIVCGYAQGNCHFENIVVTNSKIANYNRATGGLLGEVCYGSYGTDVSKGFSHTFKNIVIDSSVTVSSLWGSFDTLCGGVIGGKWGDATVKMENVVSACKLDVFSDCTAAYQGVAYRRCGMLIGHTEQNSPKKALNAAAEFLVCENVDVYYGDWVNYHYYQYTNQTDEAGNSLWYNNYPWVRAEAGLNNGAFSNPRYGVPVVNGVKVTENNRVEELKTDYTPIVFGQLYGGGQGVYGCNEHDGVTTHNNLSNVKTVYIVNNQSLSGLKLRSWFKHDKSGETWTTNIDGIDMTAFTAAASNGIAKAYEVVLPAYADGFEILHNGVVIGRFEFANLAEAAAYNLDTTVHSHVYTNGVCPCGYACQHTGGSATCSTQATCTTCGLKYGGYGSHSLYWANDNESWCYQRCHYCSHSQGTTSHQWTGGSCSQCHRTPNMVTNISDSDIAKDFDTTISFTIGNLAEATSNYRIYVMSGTNPSGIESDASIGTMSFNVSSLGVGLYSIAVVHKTTGQWLDARQFTVRDVGVQKKWTAQNIYDIWSNGGKEAQTGLTATLSSGIVSLKVTGNGICTALNSGGRLNFSSTASGTLVIKYKSNTWRDQIAMHAHRNGAYQTPVYASMISGPMSSFDTRVMHAIPSGCDHFLLDIFANRAPEAGNILQIEYIAIVSTPDYIG